LELPELRSGRRGVSLRLSVKDALLSGMIRIKGISTQKILISSLEGEQEYSVSLQEKLIFGADEPLFDWVHRIMHPTHMRKAASFTQHLPMGIFSMRQMAEF
jgi:hypothetical protein